MRKIVIAATAKDAASGEVTTKCSNGILVGIEIGGVSHVGSDNERSWVVGVVVVPTDEMITVVGCCRYSGCAIMEIVSCA